MYFSIDGQYLASRLSKSITNASSKLKTLLTEYNSFNIHTLKWEDVINLSSHVWYEGVLSDDCEGVPNSIKLKAIEKHHTMLRCEEEAKSLREDMKNIVNFYLDDLRMLNKIAQLQNSDVTPISPAFHQGISIMLHQACYVIEEKIVKFRQSFSDIADISVSYDSFRYRHSSLLLNSDQLYNSSSHASSQHVSPSTSFDVNTSSLCSTQRISYIRQPVKLSTANQGFTTAQENNKVTCTGLSISASERVLQESNEIDQTLRNWRELPQEESESDEGMYILAACYT